MIKARFDPKAFEKVDFVDKQIRRVILASHMDLDREIRLGNPFDTGFSSASWWAMANGEPSEHPNPPQKGATYPKGGQSDVAAMLASVGGLLTLANSAPYIRRLNEGYSPQAPAGWVDALANRYQDFVDIHILEEKGKSP